jgi:hypothetical protein
VALTEDEPVTIRVLWGVGLHPQDVKVEDRENIGAGQVAAGVSHPGLVDHPKAGAADVAGAFGDAAEVGPVHIYSGVCFHAAPG